MANKTVFEDRSAGTGIFEGDLKYGRCHGANHNKYKDYPAMREEGNATNVAAAPLLLIKGRDPRVWSKKVREKEKASGKFEANTSKFVSQVMTLLVKSKNEGGLGQNVSRVQTKTSWI